MVREKAMKWYCDIKAACQIGANQVDHEQMKHVEVDWFFIKEKVGRLLRYSESSRKVSLHALTKVVSNKIFAEHVAKLGMFEIYAQIWKGVFISEIIDK